MKTLKRKTGFLAALAMLALMCILLCAALATPAKAASSAALKSQVDSLKSEKKSIDAKIKALEKKISGNKTEINALVEQKNAIDEQVGLIHNQMDNLNEQIATYSRMIADKQAELTESQLLLEQLNAKNKERIRAMEEDGSMTYWSVLFKAQNFSDLLDRIDIINEIAAADQRRLQEMSDVAQAISDAKTELETEKAGMEETTAELAETEKTLNAKRAEADKLLADLNAKGEEFNMLLEEQEDAENDIQKKLASAEKDYKSAKYQEWLSTSKPGETKNTNNGSSAFVPSSSGWKIPLKYKKLTSPFGYRIHPVYKYRKMHYGVDLYAPAGTTVWASRSGEVTQAGWDKSAGWYVTVNHGDGFSSVYMHLSKYVVKKGDIVSQGQTLGNVGSTGVATGPHLHFGISYKGTYVNPANYLSFH